MKVRFWVKANALSTLYRAGERTRSEASAVTMNWLLISVGNLSAPAVS